MIAAARGFIVLLFLHAGIAAACGVCDEDKIAATYDHAVLDAAARSPRVVVFAAIDRGATARLRAAARNVPGIGAETIRVSANPAAISYALDPQRRSVESSVAEIEKKAGSNAKLSVLRVVAGGALR
jgi:hypothetical protein